MALKPEKRSSSRVEFSRDVPVRIVAIDGTWSRTCLMLDVAAEGAKLKLEKSIKGLNLKEFFLLLSTNGSSFRRCELAWLNGDEMGVRFVSKGAVTPSKRRSNQNKDPIEI